MAGFDTLGLDPVLLQAVSDLGYTELTAIQAAAMPPLLAGRDVVGRSRTGSGKTAAFGLPLLQRIRRDDRRLQALVVCPTRELATQVTSDLRALGKRSPRLRVVTLTGGMPVVHQARTLAEGAHIVVGTPGRLLDHLRRETLVVDQVAILVLDEADRMLELGFQDDMEVLLAALPEGRQTALFSATFPDAVATLAASWLRDPVEVVVADTGTELVAAAVTVEDDGKPAALQHLLRALGPRSVLVFCNLKRTVAETAVTLRERGFDTEALHGDLSQTDRDRVMAGFRNGSTRVLVATDVAARGLDIAGLDLVVNLDLPIHPEDYVHRVGRTGRAGRPGVAWSLVTEREVPRLVEIAVGSTPVTLQPLPAVPDGAPALVAEMATLRIGAGRSEKLRPGDLLGALTGDVGIAGTDVGKIEVHDRWTFVAVARGTADAAARGLARSGVKGRRVKVERVS